MAKILCGSSRRTKYLFRSEEKANRFIQYNASAIEEENGYAPIRSYYCKTCGGWHVTSKQQLPEGNLVSQYRTNKSFSRNSYSTLQQKIRDSFDYNFVSLEKAAIDLIDCLLSAETYEDKEIDLKRKYEYCRHYSGKDSQMGKVKKLISTLQDIKKEGLKPMILVRLNSIKSFFMRRLKKDHNNPKGEAGSNLHHLVSMCQRELEASLYLLESERFTEARIVLTTAKTYFKQIEQKEGMNYKKKILFFTINHIESKFSLIA